MITHFESLEGSICPGCKQRIATEDLPGCVMTPAGVMHRVCDEKRTTDQINIATGAKSYKVHWTETRCGQIVGNGDRYVYAEAPDVACRLIRRQLEGMRAGTLTLSAHRAFGEITRDHLERELSRMTVQDLIDLQRIVNAEIARRG